MALGGSLRAAQTACGGKLEHAYMGGSGTNKTRGLAFLDE